MFVLNLKLIIIYKFDRIKCCVKIIVTSSLEPWVL